MNEYFDSYHSDLQASTSERLSQYWRTFQADHPTNTNMDTFIRLMLDRTKGKLMTSTFESTYVGRQPIFDHQEKVWGYELLYRSSCNAKVADIKDESFATAKVISDGFLLVCNELKNNQKILVNFPEELLQSGAGFALPPEKCIIEILENVNATSKVLESISLLAKNKYSFALDDFTGQVELEPFLPHVKLVKIDIPHFCNLKDIADLVEKLKKHNVLILAEKVEDHETYVSLKKIGFNLFQGYFFSRPETVTGRKISSNTIAKLKILKELGSDDFNSSKIVSVIKTDTSISYRLMKYANMASFNPGRRIDSIERAVTVLGKRQLVHWLRAIILSDLNPSAKAEELSFMAVNRGSFLEAIAEQTAPLELSPESMFIYGMFSLIDAILSLPIEKVIEHMNLDLDIENALLNRNSTAARLLELTRACEKLDTLKIQEVVSEFSLDFDETLKTYKQSFQKTHLALVSNKSC
jgi:EAL and modified HD-GYP domain-containing signal transduction protein